METNETYFSYTEKTLLNFKSIVLHDNCNLTAEMEIHCIVFKIRFNYTNEKVSINYMAKRINEIYIESVENENSVDVEKLLNIVLKLSLKKQYFLETAFRAYEKQFQKI